MSKRMVVSALALSVLLAGSAALRAQTCGGTLSCTTTPAYTFTSSAPGTVLLGTNTTNTTSPAVGVQGKEANGTVGSSGVAGFDGNGCSPSTQGLGPAGVIGGSAASRRPVRWVGTAPGRPIRMPTSRPRASSASPASTA